MNLFIKRLIFGTIYWANFFCKVVSSVVDMMGNVDVNSDAGALALASTMSKCMGTGQLSADAQVGNCLITLVSLLLSASL